MEGSKVCSCPHHRVNGIFVALAALAYLLGQTGTISMEHANYAWPVLIMLVGLNKAFSRGMCKCCSQP